MTTRPTEMEDRNENEKKMERVMMTIEEDEIGSGSSNASLERKRGGES